GQLVAPEITAAHTARIKGSKEISGHMFMTMEPEIQQNPENLHAYEMLQELKTLFAQQAEQELLQTVREFHSCKQEEGQSVSSYVLKMKGYIDNLKRLGHPVSLNLGVSLILISLRKEFDSFVQNYNMHSMEKIINELHAMLKLHEQTLPKNNAPALHVIQASKVQKGNNKHKKQQSQLVARGQNQGNGKNNLAYASKPKIPLHPREKIQPRTQSVMSVDLRASRKLKTRALSLYIGNSQRKAVDAIDIFHLCLPSGLEIVLNNCHYASSITRGVISVSRFVILKDGIFKIDLSNSYANDSSMYAVSNKRVKLDLDSTLLWHCRLGHINKKRIEKLQHDGLLNSTDLRAFEKCVPCMSGKMARKPYTHQVEMAKDLLGLIHIDVCGPFKIMSRQGASYFFTFTDDFSRYGYVYLLKHKHEVFETFKVFQKEVENQLGLSPIVLLLTHYNTGVSERRNRTLLDMVQSTMSQTTLLKSFWDYALETAARILNMVPTKKVEKTPYEVWHGQAPKLSYLKVWGCEALVKRDTLTKPDKLEPRSIKCIFIGYPKKTMGYSFYYPPENKVLVAWNAEFLENSLITQEAKDDLEIDEPQSDIILIRRSTRTRNATNRMCLYIDAEEHELGDLGEPANYKAALLDPESGKWMSAMNVEMQSMKDNKVWDLVDIPPNGKTVCSKWLFKKKTDMDGVVHTYKAYLVAKGYTQTLGIDYEETLSPVADIRAFRILIAIAVFYDYEIWQIDVKTAFLNGYLSEEVYMKQPEGKAAYILRIKIYRDKSQQLIGLCQNAYIEKILKRFHMKNSKSGSIPMQEKLRLSKSQGATTPAELKRMKNVPYASAVGSIMVSCYTDAGYLKDPDDLKSQTGYVFVLNGGVVDWKSDKQSIFATSSAEAEY
ncbi:retrotransposon protein, putative, ty1-copia subclass, partial [Tanacetum coccineum]